MGASCARGLQVEDNDDNRGHWRFSAPSVHAPLQIRSSIVPSDLVLGQSLTFIANRAGRLNINLPPPPRFAPSSSERSCSSSITTATSGSVLHHIIKRQARLPQNPHRPPTQETATLPRQSSQPRLRSIIVKTTYVLLFKRQFSIRELKYLVFNFLSFWTDISWALREGGFSYIATELEYVY